MTEKDNLPPLPPKKIFMFTEILQLICPQLTARKRGPSLELSARGKAQLSKSENCAAFTLQRCGYFLYTLSSLLLLPDLFPH